MGRPSFISSLGLSGKCIRDRFCRPLSLMPPIDRGFGVGVDELTSERETATFTRGSRPAAPAFCPFPGKTFGRPDKTWGLITVAFRAHFPAKARRRQPLAAKNASFFSPRAPGVPLFLSGQSRWHRDTGMPVMLLERRSCEPAGPHDRVLRGELFHFRDFVLRCGAVGGPPHLEPMYGRMSARRKLQHWAPDRGVLKIPCSLETSRSPNRCLLPGSVTCLRHGSSSSVSITVLRFQGAMVKPPIPITRVVTPGRLEGVRGVPCQLASKCVQVDDPGCSVSLPHQPCPPLADASPSPTAETSAGDGNLSLKRWCTDAVDQHSFLITRSCMVPSPPNVPLISRSC
ncbi:MAG: hypothetical protein CM15mP87_01520 [Candidatus Neomarinimicrobiota bacterium]|nr:MAG: hypothetical protein CM15mP87_01520 [Candidatus Neomarinimicrobiota bacterium]